MWKRDPATGQWYDDYQGWDQGYGRQTINQRGQSNVGTGPIPPDPNAQLAQRQQMLQQQMMQRNMQMDQRSQQIQQEEMSAKPEVNYVDTWQMTPEKIAAYRAAQQGGTGMKQIPQGMSNGQIDPQNALMMLMKMMGLG